VVDLDPVAGPLHEAWRRAVSEGQPAPSRITPPHLEPEGGAVAPAPTSRDNDLSAVLRLDGNLICAVNVSNLEASAAWYERVLGFRRLFFSAKYNWCELTAGIGAVTIGLAEAKPLKPDGGALLIFGTTDLDATRGRLEVDGVRFDGPTQVIHHVAKLAGFFDPDGNRLMLRESLAPLSPKK
jgi:predicted enzyme related to lactoylglutathione lyase